MIRNNKANFSNSNNNPVLGKNRVIDAHNTSRRSENNPNEETPETFIYNRVLDIAYERFFLSLKKAERIRELESLKITEKDAITKKIGRHFEDRMVAPESAFEYSMSKSYGGAPGYIAKRCSDGYLFLIKDTVPLTKPTVAQEALGKTSIGFINQLSGPFSGSVSLLNEFVTGRLYERILYNRTPIIALVESNHLGFMHVRSKFLHPFKTIYDLMNSGNYQLIRNGQGAEKFFAAKLFVGENDNMVTRNFGLMKVEDEPGKAIYVFAKIDHGESGIRFFSKINEMMEELVRICHPYQSACLFDFNISKFKETVDEILKVTDEEIETLIKAKVNELKRMNVDIKGLSFSAWVEPDWPVSFTDIKELEQYYMKYYIIHKKTFTNLSKLLSIIEKVGPSSPEWENGQWLTAIPWNNLVKWIIDQSKTIAQERLQELDESEIEQLVSVDTQGVK